MKKVYLIRALLKENKEKQGSSISEVFESRKRAKAYCDFFNSFEDNKYYYYVDEREICKLDYKIPF